MVTTFDDQDCPNCGAKDALYLDVVSNQWKCRSCRRSGFYHPTLDAHHDVSLPSSVDKRNEIVDVAIIDGRRTEIRSYVRIANNPDLLRDPDSAAWKDTWGEFYRRVLADTIVRERRIERDRLSRSGIKASRRLREH